MSSARRLSISTSITQRFGRRSSGRQAVMYCSTHEMPLYPGTGSVSERGDHNNIVNAPLRAGDGGDAFREAFETVTCALTLLQAGHISDLAGFDAHTRDPLANLNLWEADFSWVTKKLMRSPTTARKAASSRCWKAATT